MPPLEMDSKRPDGRQPNQLRSLDSEVGLMTRADGSARFAHGKTEVLATVSGPADISASKEEPDRATIDIIWRPKQGSVSSIKDRRKEQQLKHIFQALIMLELHPRSSITIVIQEMSNDGAVLATAVNAGCVALMNAGVALRNCAAAVEIALMPSGGLILDPIAKESETATASFCFVFRNSEDVDSSMIMCESNGKHSYETFNQSLQSAKEASSVLFAFYRKAAERRMRASK